MADLYCDYLNGNDGDDGLTPATPKQNLQAIVNIGSGGDTFNIANTLPQLPLATISFIAGFTAVANVKTTIQAWDNGGSITIQRPDEATARVAASITVGSSASGATATTIKSIVWKNIKFVGASNRALQLGETSACYGCEFNAVGTVAVEMTGASAILANCYLHDSTTSFWNVSVASTDSRLFNNYFENNTGVQIEPLLTSRSKIYNNIFIINHGVTCISTSPYYGDIYSNTFISDGSANAVGILNNSGTSFPIGTIYNNLFYNFDGASAKPISVSSSGVGLLGHNAYFDCNANDAHTFTITDLTANDVTGTGDPFVDSINNNYRVTGSTAEGVALANPNSALDIGAVQGASGSGGGNNIFILND